MEEEDEELYEFDEVTLLAPFAVGEPGNRTFFLGIGDQHHWVRIWVEKEHFQALAQAIEQLFSILSREQIDIPEESEVGPLEDEHPSALPSDELDIDQMTLGYDEGKAVIDIIAEKSGAKEKDLLEVDARVTLAQLRRLGSQSVRICAAGRPLCPVCGGPIDKTGHICPAEN